MPTLYIINKFMLEENERLLNNIDFHLDDLLLLKDRYCNGAALFEVSVSKRTSNLVLMPQGYIHDQDRKAQDYLFLNSIPCTDTAQHASLTYINNPKLQPYIQAYPRPKRLYVAHIHPLAIASFQPDDLILTYHLHTQKAQLTTISYNHRYQTNTYGTSLTIDKAAHTNINQNRLDEQLGALNTTLETLRAQSTGTSPAFIDETHPEYYKLCDALERAAQCPSPTHSPSYTPSRLSQSSMGLGFNSPNEAPTHAGDPDKRQGQLHPN